MKRSTAWMAALALAGCEGGTQGPVETEEVATEQLPEGTFTFTPDPGAAPARERIRKRLDVDQLDRSFRVVTGGIGWTRGSGPREVNRLEELAATLGEPDFIETVDEDLSPSPMFSKFLDDAARSVCDRWLDSDRAAPAAERTFFVAVDPDTPLAEDPSGVRENVRDLLLRVHGRWSAPDAPSVSRWVGLLEAAESRDLEPAAGWRAICVALFTHPDFHLY